MKTFQAELRRISLIFWRFVRELLAQLALAAFHSGVSVSLVVVGQQWELRSVSILGEALLIGCIGYASVRALMAEYSALARIQRWGSYGKDH